MFFQYLEGASMQYTAEPNEVCSQEGCAAMPSQEHQYLFSVFPTLAQNVFPGEMSSHIYILLTKQPEVTFQVFSLKCERSDFFILFQVD